MSIAIGLLGLGAFRAGTVTSVDSQGVKELLSPGLAGCGMAACLAARAGMLV